MIQSRAIHYRLILCDTSGKHAPVAIFESATPFPTVNVGDRFDDTGWQRLDSPLQAPSKGDSKRYTVHSIKHTIDDDDNGYWHTYHLNLSPFDGPASPIWDDRR